MEIEEATKEFKSELSFSNEIKTDLDSASKWANFMAIMGFIGTAFVLLSGISIILFGVLTPSSRALENFPLSSMFFPIMGLLYVLIAVLYFFPSLYMYRFAGKLKKALATNLQEELVESFSNLKKWFKFIGIHCCPVKVF